MNSVFVFAKEFLILNWIQVRKFNLQPDWKKNYPETVQEPLGKIHFKLERSYFSLATRKAWKIQDTKSSSSPTSTRQSSRNKKKPRPTHLHPLGEQVLRPPPPSSTSCSGRKRKWKNPANAEKNSQTVQSFKRARIRYKKWVPGCRY